MIRKPARIAGELLAWYDLNGRKLPWRTSQGEKSNPYFVWLSEIMLQQTTVATVVPRFSAFIERWPTVTDLAFSSLDEVLHEWQGLGYYARARNLYACAQIVVKKHNAQFPAVESLLRELPGIGDYTAAAIMAIAFGRPSTPVDSNIIRVISRIYRLNAPMPKGKVGVADILVGMIPSNRPGDFVQAMMDLGATICKPRNPKCDTCPCRSQCGAHETETEECYPIKPAKKSKLIRCGKIFWICDPQGLVLLRRRPEKGLLGGMMEFPSTDWEYNVFSDGDIGIENLIFGRNCERIPGELRHTFTHFHLSLTVWRGKVGEQMAVPNGIWVAPRDLYKYALPALMKKVILMVSGSN